MRTEAEIRDAIKLMVVLDARGEVFQKEMVEPCRIVDRAGRQ